MNTYSHTHHDSGHDHGYGYGYEPQTHAPAVPVAEPRRRNWTLVIGIAVLALLAGVGAGVLVAGDQTTELDQRVAAAELGLDPTGAGDPVATPGDPGTGQAASGSAGGSAAPSGAPAGAPSGNPSGGAPAPQNPRPPAGPSPTITSFNTPENIDCHNGNFQMFTASWTTTNAVKVTISIDGPGVYDTYGPNAEVSLPFNCSSAHTFLLTAYSEGGATATRSITLHPRNVEAQGQSDPEEL